MAHVGRTYPVLNRTRILAISSAWPLWGATEYQWLVGAWGGPHGSSLPLSGRGLLPTARVPGEETVTWQGSMGDVLGVPLILSITFGMAKWLDLQTFAFNATLGGVSQFASSMSFANQDSWALVEIPFFGPEVVVPVASQAFPAVDWQIQPVLWTASPKPPYSTPF